MKYFPSSLRTTAVQLALIAMVLLTCFGNASAASCAETNLTTSKTQTIFQNELLTNSPTRLKTFGQIKEQSRLSTISPILFTNFTDSRMSLPSVINRQSSYGSAVLIPGTLNSSETLTTFTFQNSRQTQAKNLKLSCENPISKTARQFSASAQLKSLTIFGKQQATNLKTSTTVPLTRLFIPAYSESEVGRTLARWHRRESNWRESLPFSTRGRAIYVKNSTERLFALARHRQQSNVLASSNPVTSPSKCTNRHQAKRFPKTQLIT